MCKTFPIETLAHREIERNFSTTSSIFTIKRDEKKVLFLFECEKLFISCFPRSLFLSFSLFHCLGGMAGTEDFFVHYYLIKTAQFSLSKTQAATVKTTAKSYKLQLAILACFNYINY
jgi:hypothetical protein